jgi:DNA (cytosine-5)-methyltransferase 1
VRKPLLLDLFCCQGGASRGYRTAGFRVLGVDNIPQPRYPHAFEQWDALAALDELICLGGVLHRYGRVHAVHASPPCQLYSRAQRIQDRAHPDLIGPVRDRLHRLGLPYIIENVEDAPLYQPRTLCGTMFGLQRAYRHRLFETGNGFTLAVPTHPAHSAPVQKMGRAPTPGTVIQAVGNFSGVHLIREEWGVHWMSRDGIREAIPPAYTEFVGRQLIKVV